MSASAHTPATARKSAEQGLGVVLFWELTGTRITPSDLRALLLSEGIVSDATEALERVPDIPAIQAVATAAKAWRQGRGAGVDRFRGDAVVAPDGRSVRVLVQRREQTSAGKVDWIERASATYTIAAGWDPSLAVGRTEFGPMLDEVIKTCAQAMTFYDHAFLRPRVIYPVLKDIGAIPLRSGGGGMYFVSRDKREEVDALGRVLSKIGDSALHLLDVGDSPVSRDSVSSNARAHFVDRLGALQKRLDGWEESTRSVRSDSIETAGVEFRSLIDEIEGFGVLLGAKLGQVESQALAMRQRMREILDGQRGEA